MEPITLIVVVIYPIVYLGGMIYAHSVKTTKIPENYIKSRYLYRKTKNSKRNLMTQMYQKIE